MSQAKTSGAGKAPKSPEKINQDHENNLEKIQMKINSQVKKNSERREKIADISENLYGTREFNENESRFWAHFGLIAVLLFVAMIEIPINMMGFEIYDRTKSETRAMSIILGILVAFFAHRIGYSLKRGTVEKNSNHSMIAYAFIAIVVAGFWYLAGFRVQYRIDMGLKASVSQIAQTATSLFFFTGGVVASYYHTTSVQNTKLEKVFFSELGELKKGRRNLDNLVEEKEGLNEVRENKIREYELWLEKEEKNSDHGHANNSHSHGDENHQKSTDQSKDEEAEKEQLRIDNQKKFDNLIERCEMILIDLKGMIAHATDPATKKMLMGEVSFQERKSEFEIEIGKAENLLTKGAVDSGGITRLKESLNQIINN